MDTNLHLRIIERIKIAMFAVFALNVVRIAYRTWRYGGSKKLTDVKYDFGEPPEGVEPSELPPGYYEVTEVTGEE
jgi:hypothetical protein